MGAEIEKAENGQIAVDMFADHPENYYDFILMDVQMPVMDGRTAARTIRAMERPDAKSIRFLRCRQMRLSRTSVCPSRAA